MPQQNLTEGTRVYKRLHYGKIRQCSYEITINVVIELKYTKLNELFDFSIKRNVSIAVWCPVH